MTEQHNGDNLTFNLVMSVTKFETSGNVCYSPAQLDFCGSDVMSADNEEEAVTWLRARLRDARAFMEDDSASTVGDQPADSKDDGWKSVLFELPHLCIVVKNVAVERGVDEVLYKESLPRWVKPYDVKAKLRESNGKVFWIDIMNNTRISGVSHWRATRLGTGANPSIEAIRSDLQLQMIVDGRIEGDEAAQVLRDAIGEYKQSQQFHTTMGTLISEAEARLVYGESGRPVHKTFH